MIEKRKRDYQQAKHFEEFLKDKCTWYPTARCTKLPANSTIQKENL